MSREEDLLRIRVEMGFKQTWNDPKTRKGNGVEIGPEIYNNESALADSVESLIQMVIQDFRKMIR